MINLLNYEEFFFRYAEGDLSKSEREGVLLFLQQHPELQSELDAFRAAVLRADESIKFPSKNSLKKAEINYDELFVRYIENDLSAEEVAEVHRITANDLKLAAEFDAYKSTILSADAGVIFPDKNSLKREPRRVVPMYARYILTAAVAAGLFLIIFIKGFKPEIHSPSVAQQNQNEHPVIPQSSNSAGQNAIQQNQPQLALSSSDENQSAGTSDKKENSNAVSGKQSNSVQQKNLFADASSNQSSVETINGEADMMKLANGESYVNFQPRVKKVSYIRFAAAEKKEVTKPNTDFKSVAEDFGKNLLRMSGRGDFLGTSSAFNSQKKKEPVSFSIRGSKFDFYHRFFKNRNKQTSSNQKSE